jgi:membrane protein DedA with SNARE-associated domain
VIEHLIHEAYALIPRHGAAVLFTAALLSCAGIPIPTSAMMMAAGAFIAAGDMHFLPVFALTLLGAMIGDQIGYFMGRTGGQPLWDKFHARPKLAPTMDRARAELDRRAVIAVIISRFPLSALGPWINIAAGATQIAWNRFSLGVLLGDAIWIMTYLGAGAFFASHVKDVGATMTSLMGALAAFAAVWLIARYLWGRYRHSPA